MNKRTDAYGGSVENRTRLMLEAMGVIATAVGQTHAALRVRMCNEFRMAGLILQFSCIVEQPKERFPDPAYIYVVSDSAMGHEDPEDVSVSVRSPVGG